MANKLLARLRRLDADHVWDPQLGGPDPVDNLRLLDSHTNQDMWQRAEDPAPARRNADPNTGDPLNPDLRELIAELRTDLEADQPATLLWAQIGQGAPADKIPAEVPQPVRELLEVADGVRAGDFELWGTADVDYRRNMLGSMPEFTGVAEEPAEWYYLGDLAREPVLLRRDTGAIWWFPPTSGDPFYAREEFEELMPNLEYFLTGYVFGPRYADVAADDEWWEFLDEHELTAEDENDE